MKSKGSYLGSLGSLCKWMSNIAEEMGIDLFPGFGGSEVIILKNILNNIDFI